MKVTTKKIYCPNCLRLVTGSEKLTDGNIAVTCPICKEVIWLWNGTNWHQVRK